MPFDLYISRAPIFDALQGIATSGRNQGFFARIFSTAPSEPAALPSPILSNEFHELLSGLPAVRKGDHLYWLNNPDGEPWFLAEWKPEGNILLSTSYSNAMFLRNVGDMFHQGLQMAGNFRARLFEEVEQREITKKNIGSLLSPEGKYLKLQIATWQSATEEMSAEAQAPLEFPLGPIDMVSEYLVFDILPERAIEGDTLLQSLEHSVEGTKVEIAQERAWCIVESATGKWLTKILNRPDGSWQVWPAWGQSPFSRIAESTIATAENVHRITGGELQFLTRSFDSSLRSEVQSKIGGLGVDFYLWTQKLPA